MVHTHKFVVTVQEFGVTIFYTETVVQHFAIRTFFEMCEVSGVQFLHPENIYEAVSAGENIVAETPEDSDYALTRISIRKVAI